MNHAPLPQPAAMRVAGATRWVAVVLLCGITMFLSACDRNPAEDPPEDETIGTFEAQAGATTGGGFELMEGPAAFEISSTMEGDPVLLMRLASTLPNQGDTTHLDFAVVTQTYPGPGNYPIADHADTTAHEPGSFVSCYRSPNFQGDVYRSESGELIVTAAGAQQFKGTFEMSTYTLVQTAPDTSERLRLRVSGSFNARAGDTGIDPNLIFGCSS